MISKHAEALSVHPSPANLRATATAISELKTTVGPTIAMLRTACRLPDEPGDWGGPPSHGSRLAGRWRYAASFLPGSRSPAVFWSPLSTITTGWPFRSALSPWCGGFLSPPRPV
jgi:hypothetical protein